MMSYDGGGWAQLEVHPLHSPKVAYNPKVALNSDYVDVTGYGAMVGPAQFHQ